MHKKKKKKFTFCFLIIIFFFLQFLNKKSYIWPFKHFR